MGPLALVVLALLSPIRFPNSGSLPAQPAFLRGVTALLGPTLEKIASRLGRPVPVHVCVDTGIGRVGVPYVEAAPLIRDLAARRSVRSRAR